MVYMLPFVKDIRRLKLKMFGNTTFVLQKDSTKQQNGFYFSMKKTLFHRWVNNKSCFWTHQKRLVDFALYIVDYIFFQNVFQIPFDLFVYNTFDQWDSFEFSDFTFFYFVFVSEFPFCFFYLICLALCLVFVHYHEVILLFILLFSY
jgi:hypothetical protein